MIRKVILRTICGEYLQRRRDTELIAKASLLHRKLTAALRPKFVEIPKLLISMERLVPRLRRNPGGQEFAAAWQASRTIRYLGGSAPSDAETLPTA